MKTLKEAKVGETVKVTKLVGEGANMPSTPGAVEAFLAEMAESVDWVNADPADAGEICGALNIVKAPIAAKAIPNCNLVCLTGEEMISAATGTLETLFALNPSAVGGALPGEDFWFGA